MNSPTLLAEEAVQNKYSIADIIDQLFDLDLNTTERADDIAYDVEASSTMPIDSARDFTALIKEHQCHVQEVIIEKRNIIIESLGYIDELGNAMPSLYAWFHSETTPEDGPADWDYVINQLVGISHLHVRVEKSTATVLMIKGDLEAIMTPLGDGTEEIEAMLDIIDLVMEQNDGLRDDLTTIVSNLRAVCA